MMEVWGMTSSHQAVNFTASWLVRANSYSNKLKTMAKQKKAPEWFLENVKLRLELLEQAGKILGVGMDWMNKMDETRKAFELAKIKKLPDSSLSELRLIFNHISSIGDYNWTRFRLENKDNEFGQAEALRFNEKAKTVHIRMGMSVKLELMMDKMKRQFQALTR